VPRVRAKLDHVEAATPRTFEFYTQHWAGASFGTKFEGLKFSLELPQKIEAALPRRLGGHHHVRLARSGELRRDHGEQVDECLRRLVGGRARELRGPDGVVTGGTRGLGRAIALDLLEQGARVCAVWKPTRTPRARSPTSARASTGASRSRRSTSRTTRRSRRSGAARTGAPRRRAGARARLGIRRDRVLALMSAEEWRSVMATNLDGTYHMCKFAAQTHARAPLRTHRDILTSPARDHGFEARATTPPPRPARSVSSRSLAREVASRGITVNCVSPGFVETELLGDLDPETKKRHLASVPLKRFGAPAEIAYAVRALAAREASYVTGAVLDVTGGL
jgi:3-oxoacyl-[acyl-carrier protein] reductase